MFREEPLDGERFEPRDGDLEEPREGVLVEPRDGNRSMGLTGRPRDAN